MRLKNYCISALGQKRIDQIGFSSDYSFLKDVLQQNLEFKQILQKAETIPTLNYFDPEELLPTIAVEDSFIEEDSFIQIIGSLQSIFEFKIFLTKSKDVYSSLFLLSAKQV